MSQAVLLLYRILCRFLPLPNFFVELLHLLSSLQLLPLGYLYFLLELHVFLTFCFEFFSGYFDFVGKVLEVILEIEVVVLESSEGLLQLVVGCFLQLELVQEAVFVFLIIDLHLHQLVLQLVLQCLGDPQHLLQVPLLSVLWKILLLHFLHVSSDELEAVADGLQTRCHLFGLVCELQCSAFVLGRAVEVSLDIDLYVFGVLDEGSDVSGGVLDLVFEEFDVSDPLVLLSSWFVCDVWVFLHLAQQLFYHKSLHLLHFQVAFRLLHCVRQISSFAEGELSAELYGPCDEYFQVLLLTLLHFVACTVYELLVHKDVHCGSCKLFQLLLLYSAQFSLAF